MKTFAQEQFDEEGYTLNAANEIEGFLFNGVDAEACYHQTGKFEYVNTGGYYHSLPSDPLRSFIDTNGSGNARRPCTKDHPDVLRTGD